MRSTVETHLEDACPPPRVEAHARGVADERLERLRRALDPEDHTLLVLRLDRELSWEEIATVLSGDGAGPSAAALRKRFERLKRRLGRQARRTGILR